MAFKNPFYKEDFETGNVNMRVLGIGTHSGNFTTIIAMEAGTQIKCVGSPGCENFELAGSTAVNLDFYGSSIVGGSYTQIEVVSGTVHVHEIPV